ncbi:hypothetical protein B0T22DRAFT_168131 [Podospora appendiculata]|uniref:Uncharacterized protein n=1 Tax=Podospora appendiculata TaxID=314037 RepID=A0AAE1CCZ8_9PEZI|nr:hypothetical protein B0T22DRAFT_168131 [Podospora appendiculata]
MMHIAFCLCQLASIEQQDKKAHPPVWATSSCVKGAGVLIQHVSQAKQGPQQLHYKHLCTGLVLPRLDYITVFGRFLSLVVLVSRCQWVRDPRGGCYLISFIQAAGSSGFIHTPVIESWFSTVNELCSLGHHQIIAGCNFRAAFRFTPQPNALRGLITRHLFFSFLLTSFKSPRLSLSPAPGLGTRNSFRWSSSPPSSTNPWSTHTRRQGMPGRHGIAWRHRMTRHVAATAACTRPLPWQNVPQIRLLQRLD